MIATTTNWRSALVVALVAALLASNSAVHCESSGPRDGSGNELDEQLIDGQQQQQQQQEANLLARHNNRLLAVPHSLARFLFYNARQSADRPALHETSAQLTASAPSPVGFKRSSSALDAISGVTIGKRSTNPLEFVNLEPMLGRQAFVRSLAPTRLYDMRWSSGSPDGYELSSYKSSPSLDY